MEIFQCSQKEVADLRQQMPSPYPPPSLDRQSQQQGPVGENWTGSCGYHNPRKEMEMARPHPKEACHKHHPTVAYMESTGEEETGQTKEYIAAEP